MPSLTTPIQHSTGSPSHSNQTRKKNKGHPNWKGGNETVKILLTGTNLLPVSYFLSLYVQTGIRESLQGGKDQTNRKKLEESGTMREVKNILKNYY